MSLCILAIFFLAINSNWKSESQNMQYSKNEFGDHLSFAVFHNPPFDVLTFNSDGNYSYTGFSPFLHSWLAEKLHFRISYVVLNNTADKNGGSIVESAVRLLVMKKVDAILNGLTATPERKKWMDFTFMVWTEPWTMLVPRPENESRLFAFIKPFQSNVWLLILLAIVAIVCVMTVFSRIYFKPINRNDQNRLSPVTRKKSTVFFYSGGFHLMYILNILTNQGGEHPIVRLSFRILIGVWMVMSTVIVNSYSSTVISYMTVPKMKLPINTFEDLAASKDIGIILYEDVIISKQILEAKSGALKTLGDQARNNPDRLFTNAMKLGNRLETGRYAYPYVQTFCKFYVANQFKKDGKCRFLVTDPLPFQPGFFSIVLQKNSKFTSMFNNAVVELWGSGLVPFWLKNAIRQAPQCFVKIKSRQTTTRLVPIQFNDLKGAFFIFSIGVGLSAFTFFAEMMLHFRKKCIAVTSE